MKFKKIVILHSHLSGYFLNSVCHFVSHFPSEIHLFCKEPDESQAPYELNIKLNNLHVYYIDDLNYNDLKSLIVEINADTIVCGGWSNRLYNKLVRKFRFSSTCVIMMDNQFHGTIKQYVGLLYSRLFIVPYYSYIWVPGELQKKFALKLGFKNKQIRTGLYVADQRFDKPIAPTSISKVFYFVGRYVKEKGILELIDAFTRFSAEELDGWELHCYGTGPYSEKLPYHPSIKHFGFIQPEDLIKLSEHTGVFVLPSLFEPWGVVVQEFALAGFPLILSDKVGAGLEFVDEKNGVIFNSNDLNSLKKSLSNIIQSSQEKLLEMSKFSQIKGRSLTVDKWCETLDSFDKYN